MKSTKSYITLLMFAAMLNPQPIFATNKATAKTIDIKTPADNQEQQRITPAEALHRLMDGNKRFIENKMVCSDRSAERRTETSIKQTPFAVVLGCSDSRVSPEIAFDQGIGDIFVIRIAGNAAGPIEIDSIEYSIEHNNSSIILVLGHQNCGAVEAIYNNNDQGIPNVAALMKPTIDKVKRMKDNTLHDAMIANIRNSIAQIQASPIVGQYIKDQKVQIYGAYYHLETGKITLLPQF